ncbi:TadE/TadG family type IV pilus assembly protein [Leptolinea tardivitalis]|uniref:TadE/TadG family type IV pilus assembly protein n=1 Tax=Leptolinea tardivitalis TaxID=229920 RepID=UPI0009D77B03|nr:vWA domain-containing protein [Leptolinea tardivitalis]GAP22234.1 putative Flp pilus-assembly TadE/G-like [Leptolinea tardivitalis]
MRIRLCLSQWLCPPQHRNPENSSGRGQVIVIFAVTLLAMIFFAGLAIDAGSLYVTYGQLRRAIDAAAVAASNEYKAEGVKTAAHPTNPPPYNRMLAAAKEVMELNNIQLSANPDDFRMYVCDKDGDGLRDPESTMPSEFYVQCPDTSLAPDGFPKENDRKLVWIDARVPAPLYFLFLLGFQSVPLRAHAISEAAPIDLVIVIDTSESMAHSANTVPAYTVPYDPSSCNAADTCYPLKSAKTAAKALIDTLYDGYDHVAVVGFDVTAPDPSTVPMHIKLSEAKDAIDALKVHDDPPSNLIRNDWFSPSLVTIDGLPTLGLKFNPVYPEDRDGDGKDVDSTLGSCTPDEYRMDGTTPCDSNKPNADYLDSYDWNPNNVYDAADQTYARNYLNARGCNPDGDYDSCAWKYLTPNSTCTGCGIKTGADVLKKNGRPNSVWVMVFLSDGLVNLSTPTTEFPNGYCQGGLGSFMWSNDCIDSKKTWTHIQIDKNGDGDYVDTGERDYYGFGSTRTCHKDKRPNILNGFKNQCPPDSRGSTDAPSGWNMVNYSVYDYALDMIDEAALLKSANDNEDIKGSDMAIYSIGLGDAGDSPAGVTNRPIGEYLLRYMASVGDDGNRLTDECSSNPATGLPYPTKQSCGQYYYTDDGTDLQSIFIDISSRIYTRLTK